MAQAKGSSGGEGLELKTLVIAALASATAAIVVSHLWKGGTVIAAAMTPVIVALAKEAIARPMESEIVKRPVQRVSQVAAVPVRRVVPGRGARGARGYEPGPTDPLPPTQAHRTATGDGNGDHAAAVDDVTLTPIRTYGGSRRRPIHLKVALVTGLLAFVIGALALTLPELLFGGAVGSGRSTTLFSGNSSSKSSSKDGGNTKTQTDKSGSTTPSAQPSPGRTTPTAPAPTTGAKPPPTSTTPPSASPPSQTTPAPAPTPTPQVPPPPPTP
jgi:hypothetical protein